MYVCIYIYLYKFKCKFLIFLNSPDRQQGTGETISLIPLYHFHQLYRHLEITQTITEESSPLHIATSRTLPGNLWVSSTSYYT